MAKTDRFEKAYAPEAAPRPPGFPDRNEIAEYHLYDETRLVGGLLERSMFSTDERQRTAEVARRLVHAARARRTDFGGIDSFLAEYGLTSEEGVILMCLAEALLRIPDDETADQLIAEKLGEGQWQRHLGASDSFFVNASSFGLMLTGRIVRLKSEPGGGALGAIRRLVANSGEPVIRQALKQAMRILGDQFVLGRTIEEAIKRSRAEMKRGYTYSYDMLGEAARSPEDADRYFQRYLEALEAVGRSAGPPADGTLDTMLTRPGISVKLSALHCRFEPGKEDLLDAELLPRMRQLAARAAELGLTIAVDAEEQDRLELTLGMFAKLVSDPSLKGRDGLGLVVQAYGRRAIPTLRWLRRVAAHTGKKLPVRLVKGAYWDSEIKWAQERGYAGYPVFTRKRNTDVSYLACARLLLANPDAFFPQFATHNAHTVAAIHTMAGNRPMEFQRLHGMGEALYENVVGEDKLGRPCRIYAPVGGHHDLLAYLVRRLLENGANTSFVNRLADEEAPVADIIRDPIETAEAEIEAGRPLHNTELPTPAEIFGPTRRNSLGLPLTERSIRAPLSARMSEALAQPLDVGPVIDGVEHADADAGRAVVSPHDRRIRLGSVVTASENQIDTAFSSALGAAPDWDRLGGEARALILEKAADLFERDRARLMAVIVREAGKTLENAQADLREAVDFLRYYAQEARRLFARPIVLPGPTGERNTLTLRGRGPFVCISPWNFPLAIFTGQVAAALAAGNPVLAKPAEQTPLTAALAVRLMHEAGIPPRALHLITGDGMTGARLVQDPRTRGVAFTGSNGAAWSIQKALADKRGPIVPFIAETGGINAMIVDSTALPEQVVRDVVRSAFDSAGQRCSASRVMFVQSDVADTMIDMLVGATGALVIGDPMDYATDVGPVIDADAHDVLEAHKLKMSKVGLVLSDRPIPEACRQGTFVGPAIYELDRLDRLEREVFGPILHVIRYEQGRLDQVCAAINATGYGLTLGLHSRIAAVADFVAEHVRVGNLYVNRNQIGAVVGAQPFGGEGLSGTGPKAGGPNYLARFATERVRSTDITATGGNVALLSLAADRNG